mmetsp:Transcript_14289/g.39717  ORF Transcript_14289/g.39717 Transcript_14289/m.39717 type:complete len:95 (+) Transcript_14289:1072-1356(+)
MALTMLLSMSICTTKLQGRLKIGSEQGWVCRSQSLAFALTFHTHANSSCMILLLLRMPTAIALLSSSSIIVSAVVRAKDMAVADNQAHSALVDL